MTLAAFQQLVIIHEALHWKGIAGPDTNGQKYTLPNGVTVGCSIGISDEVKRLLQLRPTVFWLFAQAFLGIPALASELCANVMDYARLPLAAATLNVMNLSTGKTYTKQSEKNGTACVSDIPEGLYSVEASLAGFLHVKYYPVRVTASTKPMLSFWLPFGEIGEGGISQESTVSGSLLKNGVPVESAEVCAIAMSGVPRVCTTTNDLGEYALILPSAVYRTTVRLREGKSYESKLDLSVPGIYRNRLALVGSVEKP